MKGFTSQDLPPLQFFTQLSLVAMFGTDGVHYFGGGNHFCPRMLLRMRPSHGMASLRGTQLCFVVRLRYFITFILFCYCNLLRASLEGINILHQAKEPDEPLLSIGQYVFQQEVYSSLDSIGA